MMRLFLFPLKVSVFFLLLALMLGSRETFAQKLTLNGIVSDAKTALPLEGVSVQLSRSGKGTITQKNGSFSIQTDSVFTSEKLIFSHLGYHSVSLPIKAGQTRFEIHLIPKTNSLAEVSIKATRKLKPEKFCPETVVDYAIAANRLFILSWEPEQKNPSLRVFDLAADSLIAQQQLPFYAQSLYVDCLENLQILTETHIYQLYSDSSAIAFYPPNSKADYERLLKPCLAASGGNLYFRQDINNGIAVNFYAINVQNQTKKHVNLVQDELVLTMQQSEQRFQFFRAEAGMNRGTWGAGVNTSFAKKVMFEAPYIPLLKIGRQLALFDHVNGKVAFYNADTLIRVLPVNYQLQKGWAKEITVDAPLEKAYVLFQKNGLYELKLLNLATGELQNTYKISNPFATKIKVHRGQVYFLYKDPEKQNRQFLYKAPLSNF